MSTQFLNRGFKNEMKWFSISFVLHVFMFVLLVTVSGTVSKTGGFFSSFPKTKPINQEPTGELLDLSPHLDEIHLFDGISYKDFQSKKLRIAQAKSQASSVLAKLQGLKVGTGKPSGEVNTPQNAPQLSQGSLLGDGMVASESGGVLEDIRKVPFTFQASLPTPSNAETTRKISDKERLDLRNKFSALQQSFRKVFAKALQLDPYLSGTIGFEAEVQKNGHLRVVRFRTRGKYKEAAMEVMKSEMAKLISELSLSPELTGTIIRGESVFTR